MIIKALKGEAMPVYGAGDNVRDWLYVNDHATALRLIARRGRVGETYTVSGACEQSNLELVHRLCALLDELLPGSPHCPHAQLITFVDDRPGHDKRYALDGSALQRELGWLPAEDLESGLKKTVTWYLENRDWWQSILDVRYGGEWLGAGVVGSA